MSRTATGTVAGLSVSVVKDDRLVWVRGFGVADLATASPATPQTSYLWFSITKIVTATAVLRLAEGGKLDLDAPADAKTLKRQAMYETEDSRVIRRAKDTFSLGDSLRGSLAMCTFPSIDRPPLSIRTGASLAVSSIHPSAWKGLSANFALL